MSPSQPNEKILYDALLKRDSAYEGLFFVGVRTTGIFCRLTCTARKPKRENVVFFATAGEALSAGYRPCKLCQPLRPRGAVPDWMAPILDEIESCADIKLKDADIRRRGVDPNRLRRWFQKHHGMTFQAYLRSLRIGEAFDRIRQGDKVIEAAYSSGYESLSGFTESFKNTTGFSPGKSRRNRLIIMTRILTPLGPMLSGTTDDGICLLEFADRLILETQLNRLKKLLKAELVRGSHPHNALLQRQLDEYFAGERREFQLPLILAGTDFQKRVWSCLRTIPYGSTRSYQQQAEMLGNPAAIRAVARANGQNRMAIIIPCHRVIGKDGQLIGYGGGLWRKTYLLHHERENL
ncbi:methylated-DNA--[protein]-cysteine S-methyltransferase [candidate division KSB1 bacterium]|nr:methylated-DNA--[protein]-cysteine S-methyltransferase [candidate division KSB1 bacterium]